MTDDDPIRAARLTSVGVLLTRITNGLALTPEEARLLTAHIDVEVRESTTAREIARGNLAHVKLLVPELEAARADLDRYEAVLAELNETLVHRAKQLGRAEAALARIRALHHPTGVVAAAEHGNPPDCAVCGPWTYPCPTIRALDGQEQQ